MDGRKQEPLQVEQSLASRRTRKDTYRTILISSVAFVGLLCWLIPAIEHAREDAAKSRCNLGQIRLAFQNYCQEYGQMPPAIVYAPSGTPLLSWRVLLLPYLDSELLYKEFHLDEPWDSDHNSRLVDKMPGIYRADWNRKIDVPINYTNYRVFYGPGTLFEGGVDINEPMACPDGAETTLLFVEAGEPIPWSKPDELEYSPDRPIRLDGLFHGRTRAIAVAGGYRFLPDDLDQQTLHALVTRNGGEAIPQGWSKR